MEHKLEAKKLENVDKFIKICTTEELHVKILIAITVNILTTFKKLPTKV